MSCVAAPREIFVLHPDEIIEFAFKMQSPLPATKISATRMKGGQQITALSSSCLLSHRFGGFSGEGAQEYGALVAHVELHSISFCQLSWTDD